MRLSPTLGSLFLILNTPAIFRGSNVSGLGRRTCDHCIRGDGMGRIVSGRWRSALGLPGLGSSQYNREMASPGGGAHPATPRVLCSLGTSGLLPQSELHLEPINEGFGTLARCAPRSRVCPPQSGLPKGANLGEGCTISPVIAPQECAAITGGSTITIEDCTGGTAQTFDFIGAVAFEG
ncbi:hypothetical protein C8J57DRAFT_1517272 [Mycena rebaudengoi]|nr:hypothetical protein C8J57DRAFT_1517272 [Mycena rebaudengoi]